MSYADEHHSTAPAADRVDRDQHLFDDRGYFLDVPGCSPFDGAPAQPEVFYQARFYLDGWSTCEADFDTAEDAASEVMDHRFWRVWRVEMKDGEPHARDVTEDTIAAMNAAMWGVAAE